MSKRLIYAEDAIDAFAKGNWGVEWDKALAEAIIKNVPSAQPQSTMGQVNEAVQSTKDCISRQVAIDALHDEIVRRQIDEDTNDDGALDEFDTEAILRRLPPAQPTNIQDILEYLDTVLHPIVSPEHWNVYSELYDMISMLPSAQPETHDKRTETHACDLISRQAAIAFVDCGYLRPPTELAWSDKDVVDMLKRLPSAQPQSCKDAVSKADVLETYAELYDVFDDNKEIKNELHKIYDKINALQAAQPQRIKGRWIYGEDEYGIDGYHCDKCGFFVPWDYAHTFINYIEDYNFCPNCGADMRGEQDGKNS